MSRSRDGGAAAAAAASPPSPPSRWPVPPAFAALLAVAVAFGTLYNPQPEMTALAMARALHRLSTARMRQSNVSVALGYNVCLDAIARWRSALPAAADQAPVAAPADADFLASHNALVAAFQHFFARGFAAERAADPAIFEPVVAAALAAPDTRKSLGGNAALMARKLAGTGAAHRIVLGGHIGAGARALLPPSVTLASSAAPGARDEVHLILEYARGDTLGATSGDSNIVAPRANRFIVTADTSNQDARAMTTTIAAAAQHGVDLLVVAGLHMMEPLSEEARERSLLDIAAALQPHTSADADAPPFSVHIELASTTSHAYMARIATLLFPAAHSIGFNEQEAAFLYSALGGRWADDCSGSGCTGYLPARNEIVNAATCKPAAVAHVLRHIMAHPTAATVTRLHFHSLAYHILAYRVESTGLHTVAAAAPASPGAATQPSLPAALRSADRRWHASHGVAASGAIAATLDACQLAMGDVRADNVSLVGALSFATTDPANATAAAGTLSLSSLTPVGSWSWDVGSGQRVKFVVAPVPVCARPVSTVGLGDAISASGLAADTRTLVQRRNGWISSGVVQLDESGEGDAAAQLEAIEQVWPVLRWLGHAVGRQRVAAAVGGVRWAWRRAVSAVRFK